MLKPFFLFIKLLKPKYMSKLSSYATKDAAATSKFKESATENFMGGTSYTLSPLETLKLVAASSIFGEPKYYIDGIKSAKTVDLYYSILNDLIKEKDIKNSADFFEKAVDDALDFDFKATLDFALELRTTYMMRLNPAVIYIRATSHPARAEFNASMPGYMKTIGKAIANRPDDLTNQFEYYMYKNGSKSKLPSIVKRTWSERLGTYSRYQLNKYKGKSLIDLVRISHANSDTINELMSTGKIEVKETEQTWETLKSAGKNWSEIISTIKIPHMALLRNLRGIFTEITDTKETETILNELKSGVLTGKQFPFRYWSAYKAIDSSNDVNNKIKILDALEECMDISIENMPKLKGKTACLSDNSGSAWGSFNSEYGSVTVAEIGNLSSLITVMASEEGEVGVFGDNLAMQEVSKRNGLLTQLKELTQLGKGQGQGTENGIWVFFYEAIKNRTHYDNVFIYSDMQAGHGDLYGHHETVGKSEFAHSVKGGTYVDVLKMVDTYRKLVNPKLNIFTVQTAGYNNNLIPEHLYRGAILSGWTGKESLFASANIDIWNEIEK